MNANDDRSGEQKPEDRKRSGNSVQWVLIICIVALSALLCAGVVNVVYLLLQGPAEIEAPSDAADVSQALATPEDTLPKYLAVSQEPPKAVLSGFDGTEVSVQDLANQNENGVWLMFWASWCPDCEEQLNIIAEMEALAENRGVELILVDRLNPQKENRENARTALEKHGAQALCLYDRNEACYQAWGLREIPSAVVLDSQGTVLEYRAGVMTIAQCEGMLDRAIRGRSAPGLAFISEQLFNGRGGICTSTMQNASPSGRDVLSESQGLMMLYALKAGDRALFDETWLFTRDSMMVDGLSAWYINAQGVKAQANALLDDLRIWYALHMASSRWGGDYGAAAAGLQAAIAEKCLNSGGKLVDYVAFDTGKQAETISLCYLDLEILEALAQEAPVFSNVLAQARITLFGGRISDDFPLYYSSYSYADDAYSDADLNTSEALYTLWNLARVHSLPEDALAWLRERVENGDLAARYHVDGQPAEGFSYHSTAAYGLAALIAREVGDGQLLELAVRRMERMCVTEWGDTMYGAYHQKGSPTFAFDQLIPLLVNTALNERTEA